MICCSIVRTRTYTYICWNKTHKDTKQQTLQTKNSSHDCQMALLAPDGKFDVTIKHRFTPISMGSKSHQCGWESQLQETEWATLNGCKYIPLHVIQLSVCQGESGLLRCVSPGVSHPLDLAAIFPVSKINIWASAVPESLIFYSSALLCILEVTDTESLILLCSSTAEAAGLSKFRLFESVSVLRLGLVFEIARCWNLS